MASTPTIIIGWIDLSLQKGFLFKSYSFLINISISSKPSFLFIKIILWVDPSQQPAEETRLHRFSTQLLHTNLSRHSLSTNEATLVSLGMEAPQVGNQSAVEAMGMEVDRYRCTPSLWCGAVHRKIGEEVELRRLFLIDWMSSLWFSSF